MGRDIDLVINTYNNADVLALTLEHLERQRTPADLTWSVVVVDNNCTDHTADVVQRFIDRRKIPSLKRVCEGRQGIGYARRCGVLATQSPLIGFIDDDCLVADDWVAHAVDFAETHPLAGVFGGKVKLRLPSPNPLVDKHGASLAALDHGDLPLRVDTSPGLWLVGAGMVVRREGLKRAGWFEHLSVLGRYRKTHLRGGSDTEIVLRVVRAGYQSWYSPGLRMEHLIPPWRTTVKYLSRLSYAQGRQAPLMLEIEQGKPWNRKPALREFRRNAKRALRQYATAFWHLCRGRTLQSHDTRIGAAKLRGMAVGWLAIVLGSRTGEQFDSPTADSPLGQALYSTHHDPRPAEALSNRNHAGLDTPADDTSNSDGLTAK